MLNSHNTLSNNKPGLVWYRNLSSLEVNLEKFRDFHGRTVRASENNMLNHAKSLRFAVRTNILKMRERGKHRGRISPLGSSSGSHVYCT